MTQNARFLCSCIFLSLSLFPSLVASGLNLIYLLLHVHVNVPVLSDALHSRSHKLTHKVNPSSEYLFKKKNTHAHHAILA